MTKAKDEIWDSFMGKGDFATLSVHQKSLVKGILGEYAKQQAIAFSNWQEEGCYMYNTSPNGWCRLNENFETEDVCETTEQLYDQFIESQNK